MKRLFISFCILISVSALSQNLPNKAPESEEFKQFMIRAERGENVEYTSYGHKLGLIPTPIKPNFDYYTEPTREVQFDPVYDLRNTTYLTSVKNQGSCGSCWTFATMGAIESKWKKLGLGSFDLSENNLKECHGFEWASCNGGNHELAGSYLARASGPVSEANDPYYDGDGSCITGLNPVAWVLESRIIPNNVNAIKQAILDHGALYTAMYWTDSKYNPSNYTYYYNGTNDVNHAVLLVGWDDTKVTAGGTGAWIIRNSWGTSFGQSGFFYISYNDTKAVKFAAYFPARKAFDANAKVYYYDKLGACSKYGWSDGTDYGLVKFVPTATQYLNSIGTYVNTANATISAEIYDNFNGTALTGLLGSIPATATTFPGFYTFDLSTPIQITSGNDIYIKIKYQTAGENYPIPVEMAFSGYSAPTIETGKCWMSSTGADGTWIAIGQGTSILADLCIKAFTSGSCTVPAQPGAITGNSTVCQGSSQTYSIAAVSGATSYTWTLPSGWTGTSTTTSITTTVGSAGGTISVKANNACGSSTERTLSVTVNTLPAQPGAITGNTSVCQGSSQTYSIAAVSGATSYTWTLPSGWTGTSTTTSITTTVGSTGGTISVKANNACGSGAERTLSVTVNPLPAQPGVITGNTSVCQGSSQTYSIAAVSGATSYTWTLPSGWTGTSTTTSITTTVGSTGGTISVKANNACGSGAERTLSVTVNPLPAQPGAITGNTTVCQGSSQTYSIAAVSGATSYTWTLPSGWSGTSTTTSITTTVGSAGGTISVKANNACGSSTERTLSVTVSTLPAQPGAITGNTSVCQGSSQTYSIAAVSGATSYTWTLPSGWTGSSTTTSITTTVGSAGGTISVKANNACGSGTERTLSVTVNPLPAQPGTIAGNTSVCQGSSQTYSIAAVNGATSYTWTLPSGWSGSSTSTSITATAGSTGGTISVKANNTCGSGTESTLSVTVNPLPAQPGVITGNTTVCQGSSQTYSIAAVSGATSYTWTLPSGWSGSSTTTSITTTVGSTGGTISVKANNACGSSTERTLSVTVNTLPAQPGAITGNTTVCQGSSQTYSIAAVSGATSYTWTLPSGWTGTSTTTSITTTVGSAGGTISVKANNACGSGTERTLSVSVTPVPVANFTASPTDGNAPLEVQFTNQTTGTTTGWLWNFGDASTSTAQNPLHTYTTSGVYTVSLTAYNGSCSNTKTINSYITVNEPPLETCDTLTNILPGEVLKNYKYTTAPAWGYLTGHNYYGRKYYAEKFTNSYSNVYVSAINIAISRLHVANSNAKLKVHIFADGGAYPGNLIATREILLSNLVQGYWNSLVFNTPVQVSGNFYVGYEVAYATPIDTFALYCAQFRPSGSTNTAYTLRSDSVWKAFNELSSTYITSLAMKVKLCPTCTPVTPDAITGNTTVCQGSSQTYSIAPVNGATSYTWTLPSGWTGTSTTNTITATVGSASGTISVKANNGCGSSPARNLSVSVTTVPAQPGTISGNTTVCNGSTQTYSISAVSGATSYVWTLPSGWSGSSTSNSITTTAGTTSGTISVAASNSCGTSQTRTLTVTVNTIPSQPATITGNTSVCANSTQTYSISTVAGATSYTWSYPAGWTGASTTNTINMTAGTTSGNIAVSANNECGSSPQKTLPVTVSTVPDQPAAISGNTLVCAGSSQTYSISALSGATSYVWTLPSGWTGTSTSNSITVTTGQNGGQITVAGSNNCGTGSTRSLTVNINPLPAQPDVITGNTNVCSGTSQTYSVNPVSGATSYTWSLPTGWTGTSNTNSISVICGTSTGTISVSANNSCGAGPVRTLAVTVKTIPAQPGTITGNTSVCANSTQTYSISTVAGATSYTWSYPAGWTGASTTNTINLTAGTTSGNIAVSADNECGSSPQKTLSVTVTTVPDQPAAISGNTLVCAGSSQTYSISALSGTTSYVWTLPSGWTGTSTSNSITVTTGQNGGQITVAGSNNCGTGTPASIMLDVMSVPVQPGAISGNTEVCEASSQAYSIDAVEGATSYLWTLPNGWTGLNSNNSIIAVPSANGGVISVSAVNECGESIPRSITVDVTALPAQPAEINGDTIVCDGSAVFYSVNNVNGATSYLWTIPTGWSGNSNTNTIEIYPAESSGSISVQAENACGLSPAQNLFIKVLSIPEQPGMIAGESEVCENVSQTYTVEEVPGATSYFWEIPSNWIGSSNQNTITVITGSDNGIISVSAYNVCGMSPASFMNIISYEIPDTISPITGDTVITLADTSIYSVLSVPDAYFYNWNIVPTAAGAITPNDTSCKVEWNPNYSGYAEISVYASNMCGNSATQSITVRVHDTQTYALNKTNNNKILLYPNPAINTLNIAVSNDVKNIVLYDLTGQVIKVPIIRKKEVIILDLTNVSEGVYFVDIDGTLRKVIVMKT